jgi:hypothetical protein
MKNILLAGVLAVMLVALSQEHVSAWFNLYAGGSASISWGPPHCAFFANRGSGGLVGRAAPPAAAPGYPYPAPAAAYPGYGYAAAAAYPNYGYPGTVPPGYGYPPSGAQPGGGGAGESTRPPMEPVPPENPAPKSGGEGGAKPPTLGYSTSSQYGYQPVGYTYGTSGNWNWGYGQAGYQQSGGYGSSGYGGYDNTGFGSAFQAPSYWYDR